MAKVVVTLRIMPDSPDTDLKRIEKEALAEIISFCGDVETKVEIQPIAFGLKAVIVKFVMDESLGGTDAIEKSVSLIEGVESVEVSDVRRIIG
ncbi:MAG: elongation factor 1-beta [Candidatus Woesearchaeota archaeon]